MLIRLDDSIYEYIESNELTEIEIEAIENILTAHRKGYHFVSLNRKCIEQLLIKDLSELSKKQLKMIDSDYATNSRLYKKVYNKIIVIPSDGIFERIDNKKNIVNELEYDFSIFKVPLTYFIYPEVLDKTFMLSEHIDDCYFYQYIAETCYHMFPPLPIGFTFQNSHGGGNDTYRILKDHIKNKNIVYTIVDSDKNYPSDVLGQTAKKVFETYIENKEISISGSEILPFHEKENLISPIVYQAIGHNINQHSLKQLYTLSEYTEEHLEMFYPYLDMKKGLHLKNYNEYFEEVFEVPGLIPENGNDSRDFEGEFIGRKGDFIQLLRNMNTTQVKKILIAPLSSNPLGSFDVEKLQEELKKEIESSVHRASPAYVRELETNLKIIGEFPDYLFEFQKKYLGLLGQKIREWGMCKPKRAAN